MSNLFDELGGDINKLQESVLGPNYDYVKQIKNPGDLGMSSKGNLSTLGNNISGLVGYVQLLVSGDSKASKTGRPLGNKFFLETGASCNDVTSKGMEAKRHIYINNVPDGNIPFISAGMGMNFKDLKGLVPGTMSNVAKINPLQMLQSFMIISNPECKPIKMETIDVNNNKSTDTKHVAILDIKSMSPCWFPTRVNPETQEKCKESFSTIQYTPYNTTDKSEEIISKMYISVLSVFGFYILMKLLQKKE
jgi:hypothetical protein